jgi:membrane protein YqaA with SNARE-associated domain
MSEETRGRQSGAGDAQAPERPASAFRRLYQALLDWSASRHGVAVIGGVSFAEASFFPIPPDVLLIAATLARPQVWLRAAIVCSLGSLAGGALGYAIGWGLWEAVDQFFFDHVPGFTPDVYDRVAGLYDKYNFWIVFAAGFTPLPYKVFTIAGGVAGINFPIFLLASAISRSARFFLVAGLVRLFGPRVKPLLDRYLGLLTLAFFVILFGSFLLLKWLPH